MFLLRLGRRLPPLPAPATSLSWRRHLSSTFLRSPSSRSHSQIVVWGILSANVAVFAKWNTIRSYRELHQMADHWTTSVANLLHRPWTLLTAAFSHEQPIHILFNMLVFYSFAPPLISLLGTSRFLVFYCSGAVVASLAHIAYCLTTRHDSRSMGASGAINSMMVVFALLFPTSQFLVFGVIPVPALVWVTGLTAYEILFLGDKSTTDRAGHLGGLAFGAAYYFLRLRTRRRF